jgi:hypothetical protein
MAAQLASQEGLSFISKQVASIVPRGLPGVFWTSVKYTWCDSYVCSGLHAKVECYSSEASHICTGRQTVLTQKAL